MTLTSVAPRHPLPSSRGGVVAPSAIIAFWTPSGSSDAVGRVVNVGESEEVTILDLAQLVLERTGGDPERIWLIPCDEAYSPGFEDVRLRVADTTRLEGVIFGASLGASTTSSQSGD